jgi:hypothetical protein
MVDQRLYGTWYFVKKETDGTNIYKTTLVTEENQDNTERSGLEFKEDGSLISYRLTNKEKILSQNGTYKIIGDKLYTHFENHYLDTVYKIISIEDNMLKIK